MIISFNIPNNQLIRIGDALPMMGYIFDPELGTTDTQQKTEFLKRKTIEYWKDLVHDSEIRTAIDNARASTIPPDFIDIT